MSDIIIIVIVILVIAITLLYLQKNNKQIKENLTDYKTLPFGELLNGSDPLTFYRYDKYRKPYRWPVCIQTDHPIRHCSPLE